MYFTTIKKEKRMEEKEEAWMCLFAPWGEWAAIMYEAQLAGDH